jgi:hypothetical protein
VRLSDLSCASMTKEQVKCLLDLLGTWHDGKEKMRGQTDCTDFAMNGLVGKVKVERTVGLFQAILLASALRAGASWVFQ